jgi:hypothetical protein
MKAFLSRHPLLIGVMLLALAWSAFAWFGGSAPEPKAGGRPREARGPSKPGSGVRTVGAPRSTQGLKVDDQHDISADGRPPNARREGIIRTGLGEIQEMQQMHKAVFDDAAKRWNAQPRVKELVSKWKEVEEAWKTQDDEAKAAVVPQMEAMWKEALGLLREEVEKSAREADAGVR